VTTEPSVIAFGGPRALLLQVLHPLVAAGVEDHSDYEAHPWRRLFRTLDTVLKLAFADAETSAQREQMLHRRHLTVTGVSSDGVAYEALDPDLLLWVWATLIDTAVLVYELAVTPLLAAEREAYYEEQKLVAYACGVPEGRCPETWDDFRAYVQATIDTSLRVTETTRKVAASSVVLAWARELQPDMANVNPNGGAIAIGHALGSTGTRLTGTAVNQLEAGDGEWALVTMCCGGGLGTGTLLQRV
jgi:uncharacterized protein (DUF2236 family)